MVRTRPGTFGRTNSQNEEYVTPHLIDEEIRNESLDSSNSDVDMEEVEREIARKAEEMRRTYKAKAALRERKRLEKQRQLEAEQAREEEEKRRQEEEEERLSLLEAERERELQEIAAENERQRREELRERARLDRQKERLRKGKMLASSSDGIRRSRRLLMDQDYDPEVEEGNLSEEEPTPRTKKGASKKRLHQSEQLEHTTDYDILNTLLGVGFAPTCYPDMETAEKLGIRHEVEGLLAGCGLTKYMSLAQSTYPEAAAEFLSTLRVSELKDSVALLHQMGGGYITFTVNRKEYTRNLREIQEHFGFPPGNPNLHDIERNEINSLWELLTGDKVFDNWAKGSRIRNPAVAYVRKAIAETLFARQKTGPCSASDMYILTAGLKNVFGSNPATEQVIVGDRANASIAYVLVKQLEAYRGKILGQVKRGAELAPLSIGGPITEILKLAGVEMNWNADHHEPTFMNVEYLRTQRLLVGPKGDRQLYYKFQHPDQPEGRIVLPNIALTSFADPLNVMFIPPTELLIDPSMLTCKKSPSKVDNAATSGSTRRKRGSPTFKERMLGTVSCLGTKEEIKAELRDELKAELKAELRNELKAELQHEQRAENDKFLKGIKKKMKEFYEQMEKIFVKKPPNFSRPIPSSPASGANSTKRPHQTPTSESPSGSGSSVQKRKVPRQHSPPKGDQNTPAQDQVTPSATPSATPPLSL